MVVFYYQASIVPFDMLLALNNDTVPLSLIWSMDHVEGS